MHEVISLVTLAAVAWLAIRVESHHALLTYLVERASGGDSESEQDTAVDGSESERERKVATRGTR